MGKSDGFLFPVYRQLISRNIVFEPKIENTAVLGATVNNYTDLSSDLYDIKLNNWEINSDWKLPKKYDAIISTRCPYFAKDPEDFIKRCHHNLNKDGRIFVDWGLGDHWRYENYKIGWVKDGEHEWCYSPDNFLWSTVWDDEFLDHYAYKKFCKDVEKYGYYDVKKAIFDEVPSIIKLKTIKKYFKVSYNLKTLWSDSPQLYIMISGVKK